MEQIEDTIRQNNVEKLKELISNGYQLKTQDLEIAFNTPYIEITKEILNAKITPNTRCFLNFVNELAIIDDVINDYGYYEGVDIENHYKFILLSNSGYKFTQIDILLLTQKKYYIKNYAKYGFYLDDYVINECNKKLFFPYDDIVLAKNIILICLKNNATIKCLKNIIAKYKIKPDIDYCIVLANDGKAAAFKAIEFIHKKYIIDMTAREFYKIHKKIHTKLSKTRYCKLFLNLDVYDYDFIDCDSYYYNSKKIYKNLYDYLIDKNNNFQGKLYFEELNKIYGKMDEKMCEDLISKFKITCDINFLKLLCYFLSNYTNNNTSQNHIFNIKYIMKTYNLDIDFECLMIAIKLDTLNFFEHIL